MARLRRGFYRFVDDEEVKGRFISGGKGLGENFYTWVARYGHGPGQPMAQPRQNLILVAFVCKIGFEHGTFKRNNQSSVSNGNLIHSLDGRPVRALPLLLMPVKST